jgi:uncharacterized membrane protein
MARASRAPRLVLVLVAVLGLLALAATAVYAASTPKPSLALGVNPTSQSVQQGQTASYTITTTGSNGFAGSVALSVTGLPTGATATLTPSTTKLSTSVPKATSTLVVTTTKTTKTGSSTLTLTGVSGSLRSSITLSLTVTAPLNGSFALAAAPSSSLVAPGQTAVSTITVNRTAPFAGAVSLSAIGLPTGVTASFTPATTAATAGSSRSTLQLVTSTRTQKGDYSVSIVAKYSSPSGFPYFAYAQVTLVVDETSKPFAISGSLTQPLAPGEAAQPIDLSISNPNNKPLPVTNLSMTVKSTSAGTACDASNFAVRQFSGPYPVAVPGGATKTLSSLGLPSTVWPSLQMVDLPRNQDACKNVAISLAYTGSAQGS